MLQTVQKYPVPTRESTLERLCATDLHWLQVSINIFFTFADPLFNEVEFNQERELESKMKAADETKLNFAKSLEIQKGELLNKLQRIRDKTVARIEEIDQS